MDTSVPISTDCEDLARMLHELNGQLQLQTGKGLTRQQTQHYTEMFVNMSKDLDHPYCLRLLPLLLAIKDLFKSQEIDALNTTKCLHKICLKYESLGQRQ